MKILLTGVTGTQAKGSNRLGIFSNMDSVQRCLVEAGHEVERREITVGEDLDKYDRIITTIHSSSSISSVHYLRVMWLLSKRPDAICMVDDWQTRGIFREFEAFVKEPSKLFREYNMNKFKDSDKVNKDDVLLKMASFQHKILTPLLGIGNIEELGLPTSSIVRIDPSPYFEGYKFNKVSSSEKQPNWVCACLEDKSSWLKKQGFSWNVLEYGNKAKGQPRVTEEELTQIYANNWGIVSPKHNVNKTGWFRVRFLLARDTESILFCDEDEAKCYGDAYNISIKQVEEGTDLDRFKIAEAQRECLAKLTWTKDKFTKEVLNVIQ